MSAENLIVTGLGSLLTEITLKLDYQSYGACLARFFQIEPRTGETLAMDGKTLRGSYNSDTAATNTAAHRAIQLVTVYLVERGLILAPQQVDQKSNEIKALPAVIEELAERGVVFAFDALNTQKNGGADCPEWKSLSRSPQRESFQVFSSG